MTAEDTYPAPEHGWTCFHCGRTFHKYGAARDHFGESPENTASCIIKVGEEQGLLMTLRKTETELTQAKAKILTLTFERDEAWNAAIEKAAENTWGKTSRDIRLLKRDTP